MLRAARLAWRAACRLVGAEDDSVIVRQAAFASCQLMGRVKKAQISVPNMMQGVIRIASIPPANNSNLSSAALRQCRGEVPR